MRVKTRLLAGSYDVRSASNELDEVSVDIQSAVKDSENVDVTVRLY